MPNHHDLVHQTAPILVSALLDILKVGSVDERLRACALLASILYPQEK